MSILAVYREPFGIMPHVQRLPEGSTLAEMRGRMVGLPKNFDSHGTICISGHEVPRALWHAVRPRPHVNGVPVEVTFHAPIMGGGGGEDSGGKAIFATIASIALALTGAWVAGGGFTSVLGKAFAAGTLGANAAAAGLTLIGNLLLNSLSAPPVAESQTTDNTQRNASIQGNVLEPNAALPRIAGIRRVYPPLLAEPLVTLDGNDEIAEAVFGLSGPHSIADIKIGAAPIASMPSVEYETREGWPGDAPLQLVERYGRTQTVNTELRGHVVNPDNQELLTTDVDVSLTLPQTAVYATRVRPDEHQIQIAFPQGVGVQNNPGVAVIIPFRARIREVGESAWVYLPELLYRGSEIRTLRAVLRLKFEPDPGQAISVANTGWVEARTSSPAQLVAPGTAGWTADSYFYTGSGDAYAYAGNLGSTGVRRITTTKTEAIVYLDPTVFTGDRYEVEITRGAAFLASEYNRTAYTISGNLYDPFWYRDTTPPKIARSPEGLAATVAISRSVSIWNEHPVPTDEFALLAVKTRNVQLDKVSVEAGGYVRDWTGTAWTNWTTTSNPAPHLYDVFFGQQSADPVPENLAMSDELVAWRAHCDAMDYVCNAVLQDMSVIECASVIAGCGFARPYHSEKWGVVWDYDRSSDSPVQIFTPRNMAGFSWSRAFPKMPDGLLVTYDDEDRDFEARQIAIYRDGKVSGELLEQVRYEGVTNLDKVNERAQYDLKTPVARGTTYTFDAAVDSIVCRRGSLIGVQHDSFSSHVSFGRVVGGGTTSIILDTVVPVLNEPDVDEVVDFDAVDDVDSLGLVSAIAIRREDGSAADVIELSMTTGETDTLLFASAQDYVLEGTHVAIGPRDSEVRRMIVTGITPKDDFQASISCFDEASEELFG